MPLQSFWVLIIPFTKENVKHSHTETVKKHYQQINFVKNI